MKQSYGGDDMNDKIIAIPEEEPSAIVGRVAWLPVSAVVIKSGRFTVHTTYLEVEEDFYPTLDDVQELLNAAGSVAQAADWAIADALLIAERDYGEDAAALYTRLSYGSLRNMMTTARLWPKALRVPGIPLSFHTVLNSRLRQAFGPPTDEDGVSVLVAWLVHARDQGMTREDFETEINLNSLPPPLRDEEGAGMNRLAFAKMVGKLLAVTRSIFNEIERLDDGEGFAAEIEAHLIPALEAIEAIRDSLSTIEGVDL